jgi:hypothetical protein
MEKLLLLLHITAVLVADLGSKPVTLTQIFCVLLWTGR